MDKKYYLNQLSLYSSVRKLFHFLLSSCFRHFFFSSATSTNLATVSSFTLPLPSSHTIPVRSSLLLSVYLSHVICSNNILHFFLLDWHLPLPRVMNVFSYWQRKQHASASAEPFIIFISALLASSSPSKLRMSDWFFHIFFTQYFSIFSRLLRNTNCASILSTSVLVLDVTLHPHHYCLPLYF